jgi:hypothetical protein
MLARAIFFLASVTTRPPSNQFFRASGLNLLVAAIILWNTKYLERALAAIPPQQHLIPHVTPLGWEHISLTGDYIWADEAAPAEGALPEGALRSLRDKPSLLAA